MNHSSSGFYFMRHGETTANRDAIASGGDSDPDLTELGCQQVLEVAESLERNQIEIRKVVSSPLRRTLHSASIVCAHQGISDLVIDVTLSERALGKWNGLPQKEFSQYLKLKLDPPGGESGERFRERVLHFFTEFTDEFENWPLIIGSRGVKRVMLEHAGYDGTVELPNAQLLRVEVANSEDFEITSIELADSTQSQLELTPQVESR